MDILDYRDYKKAIRALVSERKEKKMTLKKLAAKIDIQYTYLSKVLNNEEVHLSEDHLFTVCQIFELYPNEIDYMILLRASEVSNNEARTIYLKDKIKSIQQARELNTPEVELDNRRLYLESQYLFNPYCLVVLISLTVDDYLQNPHKLCGPLGISRQMLTEVLQKLNEIDFIDLDERGKVTKVKKSELLQGMDKPFIRVHQHIVRDLSNMQILKTPDSEKKSIQVTFATDERAYLEIQQKLQAFLREVEKAVVNSRSEATYQLNFDLFCWA